MHQIDLPFVCPLIFDLAANKKPGSCFYEATMKLNIFDSRYKVFDKPVYITKPVLPDLDKFTSMIKPIFDSGILTNSGPFSLQLESRLREYLGVQDCALFCNGTTALQLAISSYRLSGEIITTPFTFPATIHVIAWNQITPVFCDIDPESYNIDASQIEQLITTKTTAILPVHAYGVPCDVRAIERIAQRHGLKVIYDAAPAFGVKYGGVPVGNYGDTSMFSFHATKLFTTFEGGALTSSDKYFMERVRLLRNFGIAGETEIISMGINGKINEIQCVFGLSILERVQEEIARRKKLYGLYLDRLGKMPGIYFQKIDPEAEVNYQYIPIRIDEKEFGLNRDELAQVLRMENIIARKYYFPLCSEYPIYKALPFSDRGRLPVADRVSRSVVCLPLFGELGLDNVDKVITVIEIAHKSRARIKKMLAGG